MAVKAPIIVVADAIVDKLLSVELSQGFLVSRQYVPVHLLEDLDACRVTVVPTGQTAEHLDRGGDEVLTFTYDVGVQKKVPADLTTDAQINAWCDPLVWLSQQIADVFKYKRLSTYPDAHCSEYAIAPVCNPVTLDEQRVFTGVVTLTFKLRNDASMID